MATTDIKETEENLPEVTPEEVELAFEAGFKDSHGEVEQDSIPEPIADSIVDPKEIVSEEDVSLKADENANQEAFPGIGLTPQQMRDSLSKIGNMDKMSKQIDRLFGTMGDIQQKLSQGQAATKKEEAEVKQEFSRLHEEYPELAGVLAEDMKAIMATSNKPIDIDGAVNQRLAAEIGAVKEAFELKLLTMQHKDWQEQVKSNDFSLWLQTLPDTKRTEIEHSPDSAVIVDAVSDFKSWRDKTVKRGDSEQRSKKRLEDAIVPIGTSRNPPTTQSDEDAFVSGFKGARGP